MAESPIDAPQESWVGDPLPVAFESLPPDRPVTVHARVRDGMERVFIATARYETDADGRISAGTTPAAGTFDPTDRMLLHRFRPDPPADPSFFVASDDPAFTIELEVRADDDRLAGARTRRRYRHPKVDTEPIDGSMAGVYYDPPGPGPHPGIVALDGAGPGIDLPGPGFGHLLASRGCAVCWLQPERASGVPDDETKIPLERFAAAFDWLADQPGVADAPFGLLGRSRGSVGVLNAASLDGRIAAVAAISPSPFTFPAALGAGSAARWTIQGELIETVPPHPDADDPAEAARDSADQYRKAIHAATPEDLADARAPIEHSTGPVTLVSGARDDVWPATLFGESIVTDLVDHATPVRHVVGGDAGHRIGMPYVNYAAADADPGGGTARGNADVAARAWPALLDTYSALD